MERLTIVVSPAAAFFGRLPLPTDFGSAASNSLSDSLGWLQQHCKFTIY